MGDVACDSAGPPIMRALILSDIHANIDALDAVLAAAPQYDVVWNLGDVVGYNAAPEAVVERSREIGTIFVRGNHDRACAGLTGAESFNPIAFRAVKWTQRQLGSEALQWLKEMPAGPILPADGQVSCVHGSLLDEDEYLLSTEDAEGQFERTRTPITFFGHTHVQGGFAANDAGEWFQLKPAYSDDNLAETYDLDLRSAAKYLINPGAVGQPRDRDWRAAFALYDDQAARVTFLRVPYDVRAAQMRIQRAGLPDMLASRLSVGR
jgi:diadenosine tetraphosphatase ApaH/serine/threonine PP2A family protein phosphatase